MQRHVFSALSAIASLALLGAACDKNSSAGPDEAKDIAKAYDKVDDKGGKTGTGKPIPGVSLAKLDKKKKAAYEKLVDTLGSPCGKAHSLRTSATTQSGCKRARFAARYVAALLEDEAEPSEVRELYNDKYGRTTLKKFKLDTTAHDGPSDARVVIVEFFDYGCPACKQFKPILEEARNAFPKDAVLYYKNFPLAAHPNSGPAAQAAIAAGKQGKFNEMHKMLFDDQHNHGKDQLRKYAEKLGLDMAKFDADFKAAAAQVEADKAEGNKAGVMGTPTIYVNGREYKAPGHPRYLKMWIDEELAVNR